MQPSKNNGSKRFYNNTATFLRTLFIPLLLLLCWHLASSSGLVSRYMLPSPTDVCATMVDLWRSGTLPAHINASLSRIALGFTLSSLSAFLVAALVSRFVQVKELLAAPLALLRMIPPLAAVPLLILWLGIGGATQLAIIIMASFFPVFMNTCEGLSRVTPEHKELAQALRLSRAAYVRYIVVPSATPSIITGLRLAFGYSWRSLIGAELIAAANGLGYMIVNAQEMLRTDEVLAGIIAIGVIGWLLDSLFAKSGALLLRRRFPELAA